MSDLKILTLDVETKPHLCWRWSLHDTSPVPLSMVKEPGGLICFAARWYGQKKMHFFDEYTHGHLGMAEAALELLDRADLVVSWNGVSFDEKLLKAMMIEHRLGQPAPYKSVDLMRIVKKHARFMSHKMQHIADRLGVGSKLDHEGFPLWVGWMQQDPAAVKRMARYNKQDVKLTEDLFAELRPWIPATTVPATALTGEAIDKIGEFCPWCGSQDIQPMGSNFTALHEFPRWKCRDCKRSSQTRKGIPLAGALKGI